MDDISQEVGILWDQLSYVDRIAYSAPQIIYNCGIDADIITCMVIIAIAVFCAWVGSTSTLGRPKNAVVDETSKEGEIWDPSDLDNCSYVVSNTGQVDLLNEKNYGLVHVVSLPFVEGAFLLALNLVMTRWDITVIEKIFNWCFVLNGWVFVYPAVDHIVGGGLRTISRNLCKKTVWLLKRYKLSLVDDENHFPLGFVENITPESLDKNESWFDKFKKHLQKNNVELIQPKPIEAKSQILTWVFDVKFFITAPLSIFITYLFYKHNPVLNLDYPFDKSNWLVTDIFSVLLSISAIKSARFANFKIAFIALVGLFFYDIYFVFHTDIMVKVANGIDSPIKILLPRKPFSEMYWDAPMSVLGVGDIVIPGMFISTCLRFDLFLHHQESRVAYHRLALFKKRYFYVSIICYIIGLLVTLLMLNIYKTGQPALLYIVPSLLLGVISTSFFTGSWKDLWSYEENVDEFDINKVSETETAKEIDTDDDDEDYNYQEPNDSYDKWEDHVESKRLGVEENFSGMIVYEFGDTDDENDDTFVIESESDLDGEETEADEFNDMTSNALEILTNDITHEPKEWYSDEE